MIRGEVGENGEGLIIKTPHINQADKKVKEKGSHMYVSCPYTMLLFLPLVACSGASGADGNHLGHFDCLY